MRQGYQKFYQNGTLIHTDLNSCWSGKVWPFHDLDDGEPVRFLCRKAG